MIERRYTMLRVASCDGVATLTLYNPQRKNAIGAAMINELLYALDDAVADAEVRAIVLTGYGDTFCAGGDFAQMPGGGVNLSGGAEELPFKGDFADLLLALTRSPKPVIARVNGHAMGGGLGLCAASHFAVAALGAKLGTPEVNVGLFPMMIMAVLARVIPRRRLLQMMLFGERIEADEAEAIGLVNRAVDLELIDEAVKQVTDNIKSKSPVAVKLGLEAFAAQDDLDLASALPLLRERLAGILATEDAGEGLMAFLEKRKPVWTGK